MNASLARLPEVPAAATLPPGALVLSLSGTGRTPYRVGVALLCLGLVGTGVALGWWWGRRSR